MLAEREQQDYRAGLICCVIANVNRSPKTKPFAPADFMPRYGKNKARPQRPDEMPQVAKLWNAALGGRMVEQ